MKINENFSLLRSNYLFSTMSRKIKDYKIAHPEADIIDLGIGDVSELPPIAPLLEDGSEGFDHEQF